MNIIIERFNKIKLNISKTENADTTKIVAVSKTFSLSHVMPLIDHGHIILVKIRFKRQIQNGQLIKKEKKIYKFI